MFEQGEKVEPTRVADPQLAALHRLDPSVDSIAATIAVHARRESLSPADQMTLAAVLERHQRWLAALAHEAIFTAVGPEPDHSVSPTERAEASEADDFAREELALALCVGPGTAAIRIGVARRLSTLFPTTLALLRTGRLSATHAKLLADKTRVLSAELAQEVERRVVGRGPGLRPGKFATQVDRAVAEIDPAAFASRRAAAAEARTVEASFDHQAQDSDGAAGMGSLLLRTSAEDVIAVWNVIEDHVQSHHLLDDGRSMDERRADALTELILRRDTDQPITSQTHVTLVIDWHTLTGLRDDPADLAGYGPIPADVARAMAADATWTRLVTDPLTGAAVDHATTAYRPPAAMVRFLRARYPRCAAPGCPRPARRCDLDHVIPHGDKGGETKPSNLAPLCRRHHRMKTHAGWQLRTNPDGSHTWTSPHGRKATTFPYRYHHPRQPPDDPDHSPLETSVPDDG